MCRVWPISTIGHLWLKRYREQGVIGMRSTAAVPSIARARPPRRWRSASPSCGGSGRTGARANYSHCSVARASFCRSLPCIAYCYGTDWCVPTDRLGRRLGRRFERAAPNQLWQMDSNSPKGMPAAGRPAVGDGLESQPLRHRPGKNWKHAHRSRAGTARGRLSRARGVPEATSMDHGTPWWNAQVPQRLYEVNRCG